MGATLNRAKVKPYAGRIVPVCEECDEEMYRYEDSPDTNKGGYYCPKCGWSQDDA